MDVPSGSDPDAISPCGSPVQCRPARQDRRHGDRSSTMTDVLSGIKIPDSKIAREAAELVRQHETEMLYNHSVRVFVFGAMKGVRQNLKFDSELLYVAALFHDLGLVDAYHTDTKRFEVDSADVAREFLRSHGIPEPERKALAIDHRMNLAGQPAPRPAQGLPFVSGDTCAVLMHARDGRVDNLNVSNLKRIVLVCQSQCNTQIWSRSARRGEAPSVHHHRFFSARATRKALAKNYFNLQPKSAMATS